ncbi:MAG: phosphate regulon sensor histidine kinase PhoR [Gammaproteobacteria bacterium]|nr:phosphate regulon sensor histidine kinase PhoR [Gammaproteobacteria bacterium]
MLANPWIREFWRLCALLLLALVVGAIIGEVLVAFMVAVSGYLAWHMYHLYRLERWLSGGQKNDPPDAKGIWGDIFYQVYRLRIKSRNSKRKLADMLKRFQKSTAAMPDATVVLNENWEIDWFNKAAKHYLGLKKKKDKGQRIDNLVRNPRFVSLIAEGDFSEAVVITSPYDDNVYLSVRLVPYARNQVLMVARDVTRLHQLEQIRRDFVANISHELKTPLTVMNGYLENIIDDEMFAGGPYARALSQMQQQSNRMSRIVDDLLMLSRLETDEVVKKPEPVAVPAILSSLYEDALLLAKLRQQTIRLEATSNLWLQGNEKELHSAFSNLISNAVKYTPDGGEVWIRWYHDEDGAYCEVKDSGVGIAAEHLPRLTERFYRVDAGRSREQGGTGLGLAIVKHILNRHDARLEVQSKLGEGSIFRCCFPAARIMIKQQNVERKAEQKAS